MSSLGGINKIHMIGLGFEFSCDRGVVITSFLLFC